MLDLSGLASDGSNAPIEPRGIFMNLPNKDVEYTYPRDVQTEVWEEWFAARDVKNTVVKMNTGSGKTVVGLIMLLSCLREGFGPAVYVAPNSYLVRQVIAEAKALGVPVTENNNDYDYINNKSILVINAHKLVNGKSVFVNRYEIGSVLIDDAHACVNTFEQQYTITIRKDNQGSLYEAIAEVLSPLLKDYRFGQFDEITDQGDPGKLMLIPFYVWQEKALDIKKLLKTKLVEEDATFKLPLIEDVLPLCNCVATPDFFEISPKCIELSKITSFEKASRRIFMSATMANDVAFVRTLGINPQDDNLRIITPNKADDIGERMMLFPELLNPELSFDVIKEEIIELSKMCNVAVLVPSFRGAERWRDAAQDILDSETLDDGVARMKSRTCGITVFVNQYEGIDLPKDACRILVLDGIPGLRRAYDEILESMVSNSGSMTYERVKKIEQGMGRGIRSSNDYCAIIFIGRKLADLLIRAKGVDGFSSATKAQIELSKRIWELLRRQGVPLSAGEILAPIQNMFARDEQWVAMCKDCTSSMEYDKELKITANDLKQRMAFDYASRGDYQAAADVIQDLIKLESSNEIKGFLLQEKAGYENFVNRVRAQETLHKAVDLNGSVVKPLQGITSPQIIKASTEQAGLFIEELSRYSSSNEYIVRVRAILSDLCFAKGTAKEFEAALNDIARLLGITASRPEHDYGRGPDNLWVVGNGRYLVIECKNETITDTIGKRDCNQLAGSVNWFKSNYGIFGFTCIPIIVHNSNVFKRDASPGTTFRVITPQKLRLFNQEVQKLLCDISSVGGVLSFEDAKKLLAQHYLRSTDIVDRYTVSFKTE